MQLDHDACYEALKAHDARFDGRVFVGCTTTGIYCRPICRVRLPRPENVRFFASAAAAEVEGFRPCLKCRPELAPGSSSFEASGAIACKAARLIEEDLLANGNIEQLATNLGVTSRHLRRVFEGTFGISPVQYLQTRKLLLAKSLLTDTQLAIADVAMAAGFNSVRRFNDLFNNRYRLAPSRFRAIRKTAPAQPSGITLLLGYRPPYRWDTILGFLAARTIDGVDAVDEAACYRRTVYIVDGEKDHTGWISIAHRPRQSALAVTVSPSLIPVLPRVLARVRTLFDLDSEPTVITQTLAAMNSRAPNLYQEGIRVPGAFDPFEMAARAVLGQQVTVKAARTLAQRLVAAYGEPVETPFASLARAFPSPRTICNIPQPIADHLGPLGITGARARSIRALAQALLVGTIELSPTASPDVQMQRLLDLPGFGPWTVQYLAMRTLAYPDAFPHTDYGVKKALEPLTPAQILDLSHAWRPWRSYATISLWSSLAHPKEES